MTKYVIITDATSDIPQSIVEKHNLDYIPMEVNFGEEILKQYLDEREFTLANFYARLDNKELATTTLANMQTFIDKFEPYLKDGIDVVFIGLSSGLSASFSQANLAKEELEEKYPGRNVALVDSKGASMAEGALVIEALKKQAEGLSLEDLVQHLNDIVKNIVAYFVPINLDTLRRGGRIGAVKAVIGDAIGFKPILKLDDDGKLVQEGKVRGFKKALMEIIEISKTRISGPYSGPAYIVHANNEGDANLLADMFKETHGGGDILIGPLGPVISAHTGTGAVCLVFFGSHR